MRSVPVSRFLITTVAPDIPASAASLTDPHSEESPCANVGCASSPPASKNPSTKRKTFFEKKFKPSKEIICTLQFCGFVFFACLRRMRRDLFRKREAIRGGQKENGKSERHHQQQQQQRHPRVRNWVMAGRTITETCSCRRGFTDVTLPAVDRLLSGCPIQLARWHVWHPRNASRTTPTAAPRRAPPSRQSSSICALELFERAGNRLQLQVRRLPAAAPTWTC